MEGGDIILRSFVYNIDMRRPLKFKSLDNHQKIIWLIAQTIMHEDILFLSE